MYINIYVFYDRVWTHDNFILVINYVALVIPRTYPISTFYTNYFLSAFEVCYFIYSPMSCAKKKWHFILCRLKCIHRQVLRFLIHISAGAECPHEQNKHVWTSSRSMWYIIMIHVVGYYGENIPMHHGFIGTKIIFKMTSYPRALSPSYYIPTHTKSVRSAVPILCCQPAKFKILNYSPIIVKLNAIIIRVSPSPRMDFFTMF